MVSLEFVSSTKLLICDNKLICLIGFFVSFSNMNVFNFVKGNALFDFSLCRLRANVENATIWFSRETNESMIFILKKGNSNE